MNVGEWTWTSEKVRGERWATNYKEHFKICQIGRHFVIKPSWEAHQPREGDLVIEIDPGGAFGTSQHASTRLVLTAMERVDRLHPPPRHVLDLGCGERHSFNRCGALMARLYRLGGGLRRGGRRYRP